MTKSFAKTERPMLSNIEYSEMGTSGLINHNAVKDQVILKEYVRRFTIQAGKPIRGAKVVADHFRAYFSDAVKREKFVALFLDSQHQVLCTEILFEGSINISAVYPRKVITRVVELGAAAVILGHNHPSG